MSLLTLLTDLNASLLKNSYDFENNMLYAIIMTIIIIILENIF